MVKTGLNEVFLRCNYCYCVNDLRKSFEYFFIFFTSLRSRYSQILDEMDIGQAPWRAVYSVVRRFLVIILMEFRWTLNSERDDSQVT